MTTYKMNIYNKQNMTSAEKEMKNLREARKTWFKVIAAGFEAELVKNGKVIWTTDHNAIRITA